MSQATTILIFFTATLLSFGYSAPSGDSGMEPSCRVKYGTAILDKTVRHMVS